ncbi:hypothetical protein C2G38_1010303 [Gigaspora rosea]|uniref:Uncharacterized protein n=1 Tax=Gigaspora rosea TaxID=44941 RepID=A0A397U2T5_9GLOM|nr:hypothetical protein C2G38_1010303 [Gigaspora rosea]
MNNFVHRSIYLVLNIIFRKSKKNNVFEHKIHFYFFIPNFFIVYFLWNKCYRCIQN